MWTIHANHVESNMWRHDIKKWTVRCAVWREAYGDMMSSMRRMPCKPCGELHMVTWWQTWGHMHSKHVESSIRRHDVKHEDTFTQTMWERVSHGRHDYTPIRSGRTHLYRIKILTPETDVFRRMGSTHLVSRHFLKLRVLSTERIAHYSGMRTHAHMHKDTYTCIHKDTCTYAQGHSHTNT